MDVKGKKVNIWKGNLNNCPFIVVVVVVVVVV